MREETRQKIERLTQLGYTVCEMWECEWQQQMQTDTRIRDFVSSLDIVTPLDPRDAFFGDRTNAIKLHHAVQGDEEIHYNDMISLYPCANLECRYPVGHPKFTDQPRTTNIEPYHGLVKCEILPPYDLYHPVLPYRVESKLLFPLCRTCAHEQLSTHFSRRTFHCGHNVKERAITGTWTTLELKKAIEKRYRILYIFEIWHFQQQSNELFDQYIRTFMRLKKESSGWPVDCDTEEKKRAYLAEYERNQGIKLDPGRIENNPSRRSLAKLMLNSFWGKFGQRANQTQVTTCNTPSQFFQLLQDDRQTIHRIEIPNEHMVEIYHSYKDETIPAQNNTNIFIACFTTAYARLKLYDALDSLQERVLYMDTDSVIYSWSPGQSQIPVGNYLGQYTSELDAGDAIQEFVAAGPKNYAYVTKRGKRCCKVRGFTLNVRGANVLNFGSMRDLVLTEIMEREEDEEEETALTLTNPHKIMRCPATKRIKTVAQNKTYKLVFDKRVVDFDTYKSYPCGYTKKTT